MTFGGFCVIFGLKTSVRIRAPGWGDFWDGFFLESCFVSWAALKVCYVIFCPENTFGGAVSVFGTLVSGVIFTSLNASKLMAAIIFRVSVGLTIMTLWWATFLLMRFLDGYFGIE